MTLTSVDIPEDLMDSIDSLVEKGVRKSRKDIFVEALRYYYKFSMFEWNPPIYYFPGYTRVTFLTEQSIRDLSRILGPQGSYEFGKVLGQNIRDIIMIAQGIDSTNKESWEGSLEFLRMAGYGRFKVSEDKLSATDLLLPAQVLQGCLETLFGTKMKIVTSSQSMALFQTGKSSPSPD